MMWKSDYTYAAKIVRVIDGDSVVLFVDCGFKTFRKITARLLGINAPETRGPERPLGLSSESHLRKLIACQKQIVVRTHRDKTGKYGRWLVELIGYDADEEPLNLNEQMVRDGHAVVYTG
jgi:micrococcal nuclease